MNRPWRGILFLLLAAQTSLGCVRYQRTVFETWVPPFPSTVIVPGDLQVRFRFTGAGRGDSYILAIQQEANTLYAAVFHPLHAAEVTSVELHSGVIKVEGGRQSELSEAQIRDLLLVTLMAVQETLDPSWSRDCDTTGRCVLSFALSRVTAVCDRTGELKFLKVYDEGSLILELEIPSDFNKLCPG